MGGGGGKGSGHDDVPQKSKDFVIKGPYWITIGPWPLK